MLLMTRPTNYRRVCQMTDIQLTDDEQQRRRHQQQRENVTFLVYIARSTKQSVCSLVVSVFFLLVFFFSFRFSFISILCFFFVVRSLYLIFYAFYKWIRMLSACTLILSDWSRVWSQRVFVDGTEWERQHIAGIASNRSRQQSEWARTHVHTAQAHTRIKRNYRSASFGRVGRARERCKQRQTNVK